MDPAREDLAKLPTVEAHDLLINPFDWRFDDHRGRAMAAGGGTTVNQAAHVVVEPRHIKRAMLHADIDIVGPGVRIKFALLIGDDVASMAAGIIDRLILRQKFNGTVDTGWHGWFPVIGDWVIGSLRNQQMALQTLDSS